MRPQDTEGFGPVGTNAPQPESPEQKVRNLETRVKVLEAQVLEYVRVEAVLIAARKLNEDTIRQAHELVQTCS